MEEEATATATMAAIFNVLHCYYYPIDDGIKSLLLYWLEDREEAAIVQLKMIMILVFA